MTIAERRQSVRAHHYPEVAYGGYSEVDGTVHFYSRIRAILGKTDTVLDIGCGHGRISEDSVPFRMQVATLRGSCGRVIGIDVDPAGRENSTLDEFRPIAAPTGPWPVATGEIDVAIADFVLEHIPDVAGFFSEARRVLRPGGVLCLRTPNAWGYAGMATRMIPNGLHVRILGRIKPELHERDVFPTLYRCNSTRRIRRAMQANGFENVVVYGWDPEPGYLAFSDLLYRIGLIMHRVAPGPLRTTLLGFARRGS